MLLQLSQVADELHGLDDELEGSLVYSADGDVWLGDRLLWTTEDLAG